jgi:dihydroorotase
MKSILIKNAHIINPANRLDQPGSILIKNGKISRISKGSEDNNAEECDVIDAKGSIIAPGFVDLHCHLREPGFEDKETIASGTAAAAAGGYTTVCCMPNTNPPVDSRSVVEYIKEKSVSEGSVRVLPAGCITKGRQGQTIAEMGELAEAGVMGFSDDGSPVMSSLVMRQAMEYSRNFGLPIIEHCEDIDLSKNGQMNEGIIAARLGLAGIPAAAEESMIARNIALAELTGAHLHATHVSTAGSVDLIRRAKDKGINITADVTPHHLTLTEDILMEYDTNAKVNPPLRTQKDIEALIEGLKDNTIDVIATDHAPHTLVDKQCEFDLASFGISIFETAFGMLMKLVHDDKISLQMLLEKLTSAPAAILNDRFGKFGTLETGTSADMVIIDPALEWTVDPQKFKSKGKNTPLAGKTLRGKVTATIYQGRQVYIYQ